MDINSHPTHCWHIFKNIYIEKINESQARISSCCVNVTEGPRDTINFEDSYLQKQRIEIRSSIKTGGCNKCWDREKSTGVSLRSWAAPYRDTDPWKAELLGIDYNVAPICNAKCIQCSAYFSSSWAAEDAKFGIVPDRTFKETKDSSFKLDLDLSKIRRIYFNGGEPLLSDDVEKMLQSIKSSQGTLGNLTVVFNTNGSVIPSDRLLELLNECSFVQVNFSIDAVEEQFEYIRYPLVWQEVFENIKKFPSIINRPQLNIMIGVTLGIHNFFARHQLFSWIEWAKSNIPFVKDHGLHPCYGFLDIACTSKNTREEFIKHLTDSEYDQVIKGWIDNVDPDHDLHWINHLNMIDRRRNLDWSLIFPELWQIAKKNHPELCK